MVPPKLQCSSCTVTQNPLTLIMRIYLLLFQYSARRWFSKMLAQGTFQPPGSPLLMQSIVYSSSSMPFFCNKKTRPKSWGEYYRDSTQVNGRTNLSIISKICNADHADTLTDASVFSSEVVFKDACTGNLSATGYPSLGTVHLLLFLFNAVLFCIVSIIPECIFAVNDIF